jgi:hypothetical protein
MIFCPYLDGFSVFEFLTLALVPVVKRPEISADTTPALNGNLEA